MTILVSIFGFAGRIAGDLLTSALGWASSLLFGRVPQSHQIFLVLMMAGSFLWILVVLGLLVPSIASVLLAATPHPPFVDQAWLGVALLFGVIFLPLAVGLAGYLVPAEGERPAGAAVLRETLRGYLLAPLISGLLIFLAGVGITRKSRSRRHGWSDVHVPIVVKPGGNVRKLRPDRLVELNRPSLRIGVYPSDIAISGTTRDRTRARAAILSRLATTSAHLTTSAEAQELEDQLAQVAGPGGTAGPMPRAGARAAFKAIDSRLLDLAVPTDEWDILYRLRLQIERDLLVGAKPGTAFPGHEPNPGGVVASRGSAIGEGGATAPEARPRAARATSPS
jgi:hypothetical protein